MLFHECCYIVGVTLVIPPLRLLPSTPLQHGGPFSALLETPSSVCSARSGATSIASSALSTAGPCCTLQPGTVQQAVCSLSRMTLLKLPSHAMHSENDAVAIRLLVEHGAKVNVRTMQAAQGTGSYCTSSAPLHIAAIFCCPDTVTVLMELGADSELRNVNDETPLLLGADGKRIRSSQVALLRVRDCLQRFHMRHNDSSRNLTGSLQAIAMWICSMPLLQRGPTRMPKSYPGTSAGALAGIPRCRKGHS